MKSDTQLLAATNAPAPLCDAFLNGDQDGLEVLLDLLFACHLLVDDPGQEDYRWDTSDVAWPIFKLYDTNTVPSVLSAIAPTWDDAKRLSEEWLKEFPHSCSEFEWWAWRRDEWLDPSVLVFFREMLEARTSADADIDITI